MDADKRIDKDWHWCKDSETGLELLFDLSTGEVLAEKDRAGNIIERKPQ